MPRPKKPKKIKLFKNEKTVEEFFDCIFDVGKRIYDNVTKNQPQPTLEPKQAATPQEAETKVAPSPLSTFMQEIETSHERRLEQKKVAKQFLKRLK